MYKKILLSLLVCSSEAYASSRKYEKNDDEVLSLLTGAAIKLEKIKNSTPTGYDLQQSTNALATASDLNEQMDTFNKKIEHNLDEKKNCITSQNEHSKLVHDLKDVQAQLDSAKEYTSRIDSTCGCIIDRLDNAPKDVRPFEILEECHPISQICFQCCAWIFGKDESKNN